MKYILVGDLHTKLSRLSEYDAFWNELEELVRNERPDFVVFMGDLFDTFSVLRVEVLDYLIGKFNALRGRLSQHRVVALVGNHDMAGADSGPHALCAFADLITVIDAPRAISYSFVDKNQIPVYGFPFMRDGRRFEEEAKKLPPGVILMAHQSAEGAVFPSGAVDKEAVPLSCIDHLFGVFSGHIHESQALTSPLGKKFVYVGTPYHSCFDDSGKVKGVSILDTTTKRVTFHEIKSMPKFIEVSFRETFPAVAKGDHCKIVGQGTPQELRDFWASDYVKHLRQLAARIVDATTVIRQCDATIISKTNESQENKVDVFVSLRKWRTQPELVAREARRLLS